MKTKVFDLKKSVIFVLIFVSSLNFKLQAQVSISSMSMSGDSMIDLLKKYSEGTIILNFKTDNGKSFYADGYAFNKSVDPPFTHLEFLKKDKSVPLNIHHAGLFATLRWKYDEDASNFNFLSGKTYYLIPELSNNNYVIYKISETSFADLLKEIKIKNFEAGLNYLQFIGLNLITKEKILKKINQLLKQAGNFNPIPPKKVGN